MDTTKMTTQELRAYEAHLSDYLIGLTDEKMRVEEKLDEVKYELQQKED